MGKIQAANNNLGSEITKRCDIYIPTIQLDCEKDVAFKNPDACEINLGKINCDVRLLEKFKMTIQGI